MRMDPQGNPSLQSQQQQKSQPPQLVQFQPFPQSQQVLVPKAKQSRMGKRRRTGPNSKAGCLTCKIRRIKCDETKPACLKCRKFGTECDFNKAPTKRVQELANTAFRALRPKSGSIIQTPSAGPTIKLFKTEQEYRYFDVFCTAARDIFNSDLLRQIILQACHSEPSIRYAVIAVGALDYNSCGVFPGVNRTYALQKYSLALKYLREASSDSYQNIRSTLLANLLIIVFEACLGNDKLVLAQIQASLPLLQNWQSNYPDEEHHHALGLSSPAPNVIEDDLVRAFSRLEIQHLSNLDEGALIKRPDAVRYRSTEWGILRYGTEIIEKMPKHFENLEEAHKYLEVIMKCAIVVKRFSYSLISMSKLARDDGLLWAPASPPTKGPESPETSPSEASTSSPTSSPPPNDDASIDHNPNQSPLEELHECQRKNIEGLRAWTRAFVELEGSDTPSTIDAIKLLLHSKMTRIALLAGLSFEQHLFDGLQADFVTIVTLATTLWHAEQRSPSTASSPLSFTFDLGVIVPLWLTGVKCADPEIRSRVIKLLRAYPRREGVWDGELAATMIEWIDMLEIQHGTRMLGILWSFDWKNRTCILRLEILEAPGSGVVVTERKTISW